MRADPAKRLEAAVTALRAGRPVILTDHESRENEGDLVFPAERITPEWVNFMARFGRGLICLALPPDQVKRLELPMMQGRKRGSKDTAFTVSIEATDGVTTGISARDRAWTMLIASDPATDPDALVTPGHVFPLVAERGGVYARQGHTEGSVDLCRLAGFDRGAVICEIMADDGSMARGDALERFAADHGLSMLSIEDLLEEGIENVATARLPGTKGEFQIEVFRSRFDGIEHVVLHRGLEFGDAPLVRVHSECLTGDTLFSLRCDCGSQLAESMERIERAGSGVLIYLRGHEGRGIGLGAKIRAYGLQDQGMDTVESNLVQGFKADERGYGVAAAILRRLGLNQIRLMTNNPRKAEGLSAQGIAVVERVPLEMEPGSENASYLRTKRDLLGHLLRFS